MIADLKMVEAAGIEPANSCSQSRRVTATLHLEKVGPERQLSFISGTTRLRSTLSARARDPF